MSVTGTTFAASVGRGFLCCFSPISVACGAARPAVADYRSKFAPLDSLFRCAWSPLARSDESESSQASIAVSCSACQDARDQSEYPRRARFYAIEISEFGKSPSPRD